MCFYKAVQYITQDDVGELTPNLSKVKGYYMQLFNIWSKKKIPQKTNSTKTKINLDIRCKFDPPIIGDTP